MVSLTHYSHEGLAAINSNGGFLFDKEWTKEQSFDYISDQLPLVTTLLHKRARDDPIGRPSVLTCMRTSGRAIRLTGTALPDGKAIYQFTQKPAKGYRGTVLILSASFIFGYCFYFLTWYGTQASRQSISNKTRQLFQDEIALQMGDEAVQADNWDDLDDAGDKTDGTEGTTRPLRKKKQKLGSEDDSEDESKDSDTEGAFDESGSEAEVQTQLTSSSPCPRPAKKRRLLPRPSETVFSCDIICY